MSEPVLAPGEEFRFFRPEAMWVLARVVIQSWFKPVQRLRVYGQDRIPASGPVVIASNHIAGVDPVTLGMSCSRSIRYMAKIELWSYPGLGKLVEHTGAFSVVRGAGDRSAIENGRRVLRSGQALGIFVEGTRQSTDEIGAAKTGAAMLAVLEDAPILPVCIQGTDSTARNPFHPVTVAWGTPIFATGAGRGARVYRAIGDAIEEELRGLREFIQSAVAAGRPARAQPPRCRPSFVVERVDEPA
jgi:1-acyl-sn-glycerol-3-phosphate acyltransferase